MKYNSKYDRYLDDDLVIYRWDKKKDKLVQCPIFYNTRYMTVNTKLGYRKVHRVLWETMIGEVPPGCQLDHINTIRTDNRLENLRVVTPKENMNNPLTIKKLSQIAKRRGMPIETLKKAWEANKGRTPPNKGKHPSEETKRKLSESCKGRTPPNKGIVYSVFGNKFKEHFGFTRDDNTKLYDRERQWFYTHNKTCRWEVDNERN